MEELKRDCSTCFYDKMRNSSVAPCYGCSGYSKYVSDGIYFYGNEGKTWDSVSQGMRYTVEYDVVEKPKHYMLFEEQGIEVRDVIVKLLKRMEDTEDYSFEPLDYADYAQLMQYLMRFMDKNGKEDLEKARWYLDKIIENWEED